MKTKFIVAAIAALSVTAVPIAPSVSTAGHDHDMHSHSPAETASGSNPLIAEMLILDKAFQQVVSAVSLGDGARVTKALEAMHGTMEKTHEGVHEGTVRLSKNADREKEFVQLDKEFHQGLERLEEAGRKNDQAEMLKMTKDLLDRCVGCHKDFRR